MRLKVEMDPGTSIEAAFRQAIALARKLGVTVDFKFNDVLCVAYQDGDVVKGVENYHNAGKTQTKNIAFS
ncbi:hypothetical protein HZP82_04660 [Elizabethkingia anophelis]|nr:hypothetical protein [Elizabethkingia anophelis]MCT4104506.1 hypothetical protein [Elizabethkingia anophelis]